MADFTRAVEIDPTDARAYSDRASVTRATAIRLAIADYSKAIEIIPTDAEAYRLRADPIKTRATSMARSPITTRRSSRSAICRRL